MPGLNVSALTDNELIDEYHRMAWIREQEAKANKLK